jgi:dipeptidyl aminopeptidase/acylaminoacyl peptidase
VNDAGGPGTDLTAGLDRNVMVGEPGYPGALPRAADDPAGVLFCARDRGCTHLYAVDERGGPPRRLVAGAGRVVSGLTVAKERAAFVLATPRSFGEVATFDLATGDETIHTDHGASLSDAEPYARVAREFGISDGTRVEGWLMRDPAATGSQPLLLDVHGGPHNAWNGAADEVHLYHHELVSQGWTILILNPRGSDGYGEAFFTAVRGAWGVSDQRDFLEPIDALVAEGVADPARLAITGYSYGGFTTCYLTSRDGRFAAAVAGGPVTDLVSMVGTSDNRHALASAAYRGQPWSDAERYASMNPFAAVDRVTTPTLLLHGDADWRCPIGQAQQWHTALRERGIPTRLVVYPGGSHGFVLNGRPSHRLDYNRRVVDWVTRFVQ